MDVRSDSIQLTQPQTCVTIDISSENQTRYEQLNITIGLEPSLGRGGDVSLERVNSGEASICAPPGKIFTSVNMLPSEAKPTRREGSCHI